VRESTNRKWMSVLCIIAVILGCQVVMTASAFQESCGGACHSKVGFPEDEPFLRAAASYAIEYKVWLRTKREAAADLARGGQVTQYADQLEAGAARLSQAAQPYPPALSSYLDHLRARGVSPTRAQWLKRLHGLYTP